MDKLVKTLIKNNKTIATMESCTGGGIANAITNIEGAREVLKYSAVTYSNEYKIKMGVSEEVISKYSVYSIEVAREMAFNISKFADSDYGIGVTGKLNRVDKFNHFGSDNTVFVSVYKKANNQFYDMTIEANKSSRKENKAVIIDKVKYKVLELI